MFIKNDLKFLLATFDDIKNMISFKCFFIHKYVFKKNFFFSKNLIPSLYTIKGFPKKY